MFKLVQGIGANTAEETAQHRLRGKLIKHALISGIAAFGFAWLLSRQIAETNWDEIRGALQALTIPQILGSALCTLVSFWAVGQYDAVVHRHLATGISTRVARRAGICALALSQTVGMGVISGAILRWRMLPDQTLAFASKITFAVTFSFLAGWALWTALILLLVPNAPHKEIAAGVVVILLILIAICGFGFWQGVIKWRLPNMITLSQMQWYCVIDTVFAALALYILLSLSFEITFLAFLPAFLLAFGFGLVSGSPGGLGAFEFALLSYLPLVQPANQTHDVLAAILVWRAVYFALPALFGAYLAIRGPEKTNTEHSGAAALWHPTSGLLIKQTHHSLVAFSNDRLGKAAQTEALSDLFVAAQNQNKAGVLYHASQRESDLAQKLGARSVRLARQAWLNTTSMSIDVPQRAQLRRKLRKAHAGGVQVSHLSLDQTVPLWPQLARVAAEWTRRHGRERGFSMGQFSRATLSNQRIYVALQSGQLVGFVTFDIHPDHWSLDLIRYGQNVPDGTMHLLIMTAIQDAAARQISRLSLAAVPEACFADTAYPLATRLLCGLGVIKPGLLQFKSSFAPDWEPLHLLGRNWLDIAVAMASISRAVFVSPNKSREIEHHVADFEFASADQSWHRR